jgi:hypothetical protein
MEADPVRTLTAVRTLWETAADTANDLATRAVSVLVAQDAAAWIQFVINLGADPLNDHRLRDVLLGAARARRETNPFAALTEKELANSYELLHRLFPPDEDRFETGAHFVSAEEDARMLRSDVLTHLVERGTAEAVTALSALTAVHPEQLSIRSALLRARTAMFATAWLPPSSDDLARLFADSARRLVRSEEELAALLVNTVRQVEADASAHGELLWDRLPKRYLKVAPSADAWLPKPEAALSGYLAHEVALRLGRRGLAVNREVLIHPRDAYDAGDRTDVLVEATVRADDGAGIVPERLAVVIEVKGCWNKALESDQRSQLAERYLPEAQAGTGIYLVGWFPTELWSDIGDWRLTETRKITPADLDATLLEQAQAILTELQVRTIPLRVTWTRPSSASSW